MNKNRPRTVLHGCELHAHTAGCVHAHDLLTLGATDDRYRRIRWHGYIEAYERAYGVRPDPAGMFRDALGDGADGLARFEQAYVLNDSDAGSLDRFLAKLRLAMAVTSHLRFAENRADEFIDCIVARAAREQLDYIEYRARCAARREIFVRYHVENARLFQEASTRHAVSIGYIVTLSRTRALEEYEWLKDALRHVPGLADIVVGIDFSGKEEGHPPQPTLGPCFAQIRADHKADPTTALKAVCHVGESFFDKSLESAIRWVHQVAEMGARRLGHAIALGIEPADAVARRGGSHQSELLSERLDQIDYDLAHADQLARYHVRIDCEALIAERERLSSRSADTPITRPYDARRLRECAGRQAFVIDRLVELGTVIEVCPTSNLRIAGLNPAQAHPLRRFIKTDLQLVLGTDDPGIFGVTLDTEIETAARIASMTVAQLAQRLGDPRRFAML